LAAGRWKQRHCADRQNQQPLHVSYLQHKAIVRNSPGLWVKQLYLTVAKKQLRRDYFFNAVRELHHRAEEVLNFFRALQFARLRRWIRLRSV